LLHHDAISEKTLKMIDSSVAHLKEGTALDPVDMEELNKLLD